MQRHSNTQPLRGAGDRDARESEEEIGVLDAAHDALGGLGGLGELELDGLLFGAPHQVGDDALIDRRIPGQPALVGGFDVFAPAVLGPFLVALLHEFHV